MGHCHPTIKGIFVNSHIQALRREKGEAGLRRLEGLFGRPIRFKNLDDVLVSDEVRIIEYCLDLLRQKPVPKNKRAFQAGRLHFRNFIKTPLARILFSVIQDPKRLLLNSKYIAEHVFRGIVFSSADLGPNRVMIHMEGGQYPLDHFKGLFWEWVHHMGRRPSVEARQPSPQTYEYVIHWEGKG